MNDTRVEFDASTKDVDAPEKTGWYARARHHPERRKTTAEEKKFMALREALLQQSRLGTNYTPSIPHAAEDEDDDEGSDDTEDEITDSESHSTEDDPGGKPTLGPHRSCSPPSSILRSVRNPYESDCWRDIRQGHVHSMKKYDWRKEEDSDPDTSASTT